VWASKPLEIEARGGYADHYVGAGVDLLAGGAEYA
jgi:hypothetical protein